MKPLWILQEDIFDEDISRLQKSILDYGATYDMIKYMPFDYSVCTLDMNGNAYLSEDKWSFPYGSLNWVIRLETTIGPHSYFNWLDLDKYKCSYYYPRMQAVLLNWMSVFVPYGRLKCADYQRLLTIDAVGDKGAVFLRPDDGFKSFTGQVVRDWDRDLQVLDNLNLSPEMMCVASCPHKLYKEYRCIIGHDYPHYDTPKRLITASCYKDDGVITEYNADDNDKLSRYVQEVLDKTTYDPAPFWVLDVCESRNGMRVVEVNNINCSGFYQCDTDKIVKNITDYMLEESKDYEDHLLERLARKTAGDS